MELYTIERGIMRQVPEDWELKQIIKYVLIFIVGVVLGNAWRIS
ncbi:MAG: hypothetical protein ABIJ57_02605 [Pseudomonadota bacterium]